MSNNKPGSFLDPKTISAVVFCFAGLVLWQSYLAKKYPDYYKNKNQKTQVVEEGKKTKSGEATLRGPEPETLIEKTVTANQSAELPKESLVSFKNESLEFQISSHGMGIRNINVKKYTTRDGEVIQLSHNSVVPLFSLNSGKSLKPILFDIERVSDTKFVGRAVVEGISVTRELQVEGNYKIASTIHLKGERLDSIVALDTVFAEKINLPETAFSLMPSYDNKTYFVMHGTDTSRVIFSEDDHEERYREVGLVSVDTHYFTRTLIDNSKILPELELKYAGGADTTATGRLRYSLKGLKDETTLSQTLFLGPKDRDILVATDARLEEVVDFGMFSFIAHPILDLLKWFYSLVGNWGVAIILMTIVVRFILLPLHVVSFKSMKKMQDLQPQLKALKEKYKDDKETLNKETMELMRTSGANPIGGCLPMLLQFPVFIALFQVLGNAIELYQAPFYIWIDDLSLRDPYFVLPVLMMIAMLLQQKLTPTTPDPSQKKMMMFVTVMFGAFLVFYPSGLALYIFVGSLFSIIQQMILMREKGTSTQTVEA